MYLFDTSFVSTAVNSLAIKHVVAQNFLTRNAGVANRFYVSVITLSELEFGRHLMDSRGSAAEKKKTVSERIEAAKRLARPIPVDRHVAREHARLRAAYATVQCPKLVVSGDLKGKHVEQWHEEFGGPVLQINENDLWIAAVALTHDMTLVGVDGDHEKLTKAVTDLRVQIL